MGLRLELHEILVKILGSDQVYFQPPETIKMKYPCIVYGRGSGDTIFADNSAYRFTQRYQITVIDRDPDSKIPEKIADLPMCTYDRHYNIDNLNHDVFNLYF